MKRLILLINIIFIISNVGCFHQSKNDNNGNKLTISKGRQKIEKVQLTEQTRGVNESSTFTSDFIISSLNGETTKSPISASYWLSISAQAEMLDLSKIANLQSPTTGRYSDQALSATIVITANGTTFTSASFDAGKPPRELEALYSEIKKGSVKTKGKP
ncbi:hypothetical protein CEY12_06410 [Chryseobacterium sp. T16E-39]|uniref:hypothetical protein n=1 Tax=Chryseobacterium sp. T16E-39 TaxID=2015076 RepID=UPI000B5B1D78|nr:hypothetical protein [Chryseobacterium sp. T16E-39]ASK29760.1 hypothetical protein CEY12_06410 [Chryseobacterium sp. T16E-39]